MPFLLTMFWVVLSVTVGSLLQVMCLPGPCCSHPRNGRARGPGLGESPGWSSLAGRRETGQGADPSSLAGDASRSGGCSRCEAQRSRLPVLNVTRWTGWARRRRGERLRASPPAPVPVTIFPEVCPGDGSASHVPPPEFLTFLSSSARACPVTAVLTMTCEPVSLQRVLRSGGFYSRERFSCLFVSKKHVLDSESLRI